MNGDGSTDQAAEAVEDPAKDHEAKEPAESSEAPEDEEKPPDPFDTATEHVIESNAAIRAAYRLGRLNFKDSGPVVAQSSFRDVVSNVTHVYATSTATLSPGPVRAEELKRIRASYVEADDYDAVRSMLQDRRLVLLRGSAGTGRTTTALHLLDAVAGGRISRLDPTAEVHSLTAEAFKGGGGYLGELLTSSAIALTEMHLDRLIALLEKEKCWCVLIVESDFLPTSAVAGYIADHRQPDVKKVLDKHLYCKIPEADVDIRDQLLAFEESPEMRAALGPAPSLAEVVLLAGYLDECHRQILTREDVVIRCAAFVDQVVARWFDVHNLPRDRSGDLTLVAIQQGSGAGGSQGWPVNSWVRTLRVSSPHLVAVLR
ncbi:MAG: hypothetical protein M3460_23640 [Actinomycetota bacterium]|nr:hypothetical protein [Actinomycetota bacterium]